MIMMAVTKKMIQMKNLWIEVMYMPKRDSAQYIVDACISTLRDDISDQLMHPITLVIGFMCTDINMEIDVECIQ